MLQGTFFKLNAMKPRYLSELNLASRYEDVGKRGYTYTFILDLVAGWEVANCTHCTGDWWAPEPVRTTWSKRILTLTGLEL
jgi:hypothetical protein